VPVVNDSVRARVKYFTMIDVRSLVPAFDLVMRCGELVYHLNCFSCSECQQKFVSIVGPIDNRLSVLSRFCVGDRYFLYNNQILCEDDHERTRKAQLSSSTDDDVSLFSK
jgi:hypothetical protein